MSLVEWMIVISGWSNNSRFVVLPIISPSRVHSVSEMKSFVPVSTCRGRDLHSPWFSVNVSDEQTVNFTIGSSRGWWGAFFSVMMKQNDCVQLLLRWCFYEFITQATCWVVVSDLRWTSLCVRDQHFLSDWFIWKWWVISRRNRSLDTQYFSLLFLNSLARIHWLHADWSLSRAELTQTKTVRFHFSKPSNETSPLFRWPERVTDGRSLP